MRRCHDAMDLEKKLHAIHVKMHSILGLEEPAEKPLMRVRVKSIAAKNNPLLLNSAFLFHIKFETIGDAHYKCKTHASQYASPSPDEGAPATDKAAKKNDGKGEKVEKHTRLRWTCYGLNRKAFSC